MNNGVTYIENVTWKWCLDGDLQSSCFRLENEIKLADALAHLYVKQSIFFTTELWEFIKNIFSFVCSWTIIYIHVIAYASQTKEWTVPMFYKTAPKSDENRTSQSLHKIKKKAGKKERKREDKQAMFVEWFSLSNKFVTLIERYQATNWFDVKEQSENGNSYCLYRSSLE